MSAEAKKEEPGIFRELYSTFFSKSWHMWIGSIILAILSICLFMIASPWGSSGGLSYWGHDIFKSIGLDFTPNANAYNYALLSLLVIFGALASALLGKEFAIRVAPAGELFKGLLGGILMGVGCIIGMGCTIGNFFSGWAALSAGAIIFVLGLVIGVFFAVKYLLWEMEKHPKMSSGKSSTFLQAKTKGTSLQPLAGLIVIVFGLILTFTFNNPIWFGFALIGLFIGMVLQRSRWCIVRALREPFMTGDSEPAVAIIAGLIVGLLGFSIIKILSIGSPEQMALWGSGWSSHVNMSMVASNFWMPAIIGGIIFGFGMTIAGGCTVGSSWRAGEGHVKLWLALVGIIFAAPITAKYIQPAFLNMLPTWMQQKIFLPDHFSFLGAIIIMLLILLIWYIFVKWNERTGRFSAM